MSVPSMVHRSGDSLIVRSVVSGDALYESADDVVIAEDEDYSAVVLPDSVNENKDLPDCKVKRNYTCQSCDFFTQNPRVYLYHLRDVHKEKVKIYECPNCLYASKHFQKLLRHTKMVHGTSEGVETNETFRKSRKRPASVEEDDVREESSEGDAAEEAVDDMERPSLFKCSVCEFTSRNQALLSKHEREEHIKTKFFRCSKCTYVTHIKARYTKHVKYHSMPMIKCDMCDFRTPYKWNLDRHCKNHNGKGAFKCSACNFTADIKQSLTVHEMNHHVPPVGQAAGLGVGRRRNKVGASDATAAEEAAAQQVQVKNETAPTVPASEEIKTKAKVKVLAKKSKTTIANGVEQPQGKLSDFIHPDDIIHHANGKVYIKNKCKFCNFKSAWDGEMAKHEKKVHNIDRENNVKTVVKKNPRPIPNLIPIPSQTSVLKQRSLLPPLKVAEIPELSEPVMSQKVINDICAKSANSALKDFASLFGSEDVFKNPSSSKVPDLIPTSIFTSTPKIKNSDTFKQKNASFFDRLKEKLEIGTGCNLICSNCGHESKCLTEQAKHQKTCGKEISKIHNTFPVHNISSSRCQFCRQRCKSSADLYNHLQTCSEALNYQSNELKEEQDTSSEHDGELRIDEDQGAEEIENKPHPMENKVFVWNDIMVPMDIEVDDSNYEYTEDKVDDNVSLDLSIRTQSPACSENSYLTQENCPSVHHSPVPTTEKIPTHGNDISVAQHKRVFKCPHCTFWASTASRFHVHIVGHLNKKPFECSLCSYRSNWRWDITKHIKLKSVRDQAHETAKVLMTDETGRRNYTKYNKYLTEIPVSSLQSSSETSGGSGTRHKHHDRNSSPSTSKSDLPKLSRVPNSNDFSPLLKTSPVRPPPPLKAADGQFFAQISHEKKRPSTESKRTLFKCKKCNFRDASREILLHHVKGHYQQQCVGLGTDSPMTPSYSTQDLSLRGTSPDRDERHCRLKHSGDIRVVSNKNGQEKIEVEEQPDEPDHMDIPQEGTYKCDFCPFASDNHVDFEQHVKGHVSNFDSPLKCNFCKFSLSRKEDLVFHLKLHGIFDPDDDFLNKMASNDLDSKKFRCIICPYVTNSKSQYTYHKQFHRPRGGQYTCTHCSYNVSKRHLLHQHLKVHGINITPHKQNGEVIDLDEISDEIEEVSSPNNSFDAKSFGDIPLVWVSKNGKFSKMFKCRYCPHVNLRKVNIQEHEKMHSTREKNPNSSRTSDVEHRCTECNYICNNAGVLSSHSKVHQGLYGTVHRLVDPTKTDEEQISDLSRTTGIQHIPETIENMDGRDMDGEEIDTCPGSVLYFCKECPARFLKENEFSIHRKFHNSWLMYKCDYCSYATQNKHYLMSHSHIHTDEYQERTRVFRSMYVTSPNSTPPSLCQIRGHGGEMVWVVQPNIKTEDVQTHTLSSILSRPVKSTQNVPLSGTELFQQKSEAQQKHAAEAAQKKEQASFLLKKTQDSLVENFMHGNPEFIYPTYLKNGRMKEKRYKCHKCPSAFEKREQYKVHLGLHGSNQRYNCDFCDYSVKYYANYVQHLKKHKYSDDAQAARKSSDGAEEPDEIDESVEVTSEINVDGCDGNGSLKLSAADQQMLAIKQQRKSSRDETIEDKKIFWCPYCPYTSFRKDAVENHQKRHTCVSGVRNTYFCDHCDYSVPQAHFLRDHSKLHFMPNKVNHLDGYMMCDNLKLTSNKIEASNVKVENEDVLFEEYGSKVEDAQFLPPLSADIEERFNNNEGEKLLVNIQTGDLVNKSDKQSLDTEGDCKIKVN